MIDSGFVTFNDVFIVKKYGMEELDLIWQFLNLKTVSKEWAYIDAEKQQR